MVEKEYATTKITVSSIWKGSLASSIKKKNMIGHKIKRLIKNFNPHQIRGKKMALKEDFDNEFIKALFYWS